MVNTGNTDAVAKTILCLHVQLSDKRRHRISDAFEAENVHVISVAKLIRLNTIICSYFEKGCRRKCTRQSRKVLWVVLSPLSSKKFDRMAGEAVDICLRVLNESNKSYRFDSYSIRNSVLLLSHFTFRDCRVHIFSDNFLEIAVINTRLDNCIFRFALTNTTTTTTSLFLTLNIQISHYLQMANA